MDISTILSLLRRRWRVVVPTAVIVGALLTVMLVVQPPTYRASSTVVLLAPPQPPELSKPSASNPYVRFNDIAVVADIVSRVLSSDTAVEGLRSKGLKGTYTAAANTDFLSGPIIQITAESPSKADAINDVKLVVDGLAKQLAALQTSQGTARRYFFTSEVIVPPTKATVVFSSVLRRLFVAFVLGVGLVIGVAVLADALARGLGHRRERLATSSSEAPPRTD